jgi:hypothetical protein
MLEIQDDGRSRDARRGSTIIGQFLKYSTITHRYTYRYPLIPDTAGIPMGTCDL